MLSEKKIVRTIIEQLGKNPSWKIIVLKNNWLCPFCAKIGARDLKMSEEVEQKIAWHFINDCDRWDYFRAEPMDYERLKRRAKVIVFKHKLAKTLSEDPRFRFADREGSWLCPYCGRPTGIAFDPQATEVGELPPEEDALLTKISRHLLECADYARGEDAILSERELETRRERSDRQRRIQRVRERLRDDPTWRFADALGRWLCPFCAEPVDVQMPADGEGEPPEDALLEIAGHVEMCKACSILDGKPRPVHVLKERVLALNRERTLGHIKRKLLRHAVWQFHDLDRSWFCPYCARATYVRVPAALVPRETEAGGAAAAAATGSGSSTGSSSSAGVREDRLDRYATEVLQHLEGCEARARRGKCKSRNLLETRIAEQNESIRERRAVRRSLLEDQLFSVTDRYGSWVCPFCVKVMKPIQLGASTETAVFDKIVEQVVGHLRDGCTHYRPGEKPDATIEELEAVARGPVAHRVEPLAVRVGGEAQPDEEWLRMQRDLQEIRSKVEIFKERERSLEEARAKQLQMLPSLPEVPGFDFGYVYRPCDTIGGDFYDFVRVSDSTFGIAVGDVSGHGIEAALLVGTAKKLLEVHGRGRVSTRQTLLLANADIFPELDSKSFVTVFYGVLDTEKKSLTFSRAGHNALILYNERRSPPLQVLDSKGMALGMDEGAIFQASLEEFTLELIAGDLLVQYTDGVHESMNEAREEFGLSRLYETIEQFGSAEAEYVLYKIEKALEAFTDGTSQKDDVTMVAVKVL